MKIRLMILGLLIILFLMYYMIVYGAAFGAEIPERDVASPLLKSERNVLSPKVCLPNGLTHAEDFETWLSVGMGGIRLIGQGKHYVRGAVVVYFDPHGVGGILVVGAEVKEHPVLVGITQIKNGASRSWRDDRYVTEDNIIRTISGTFCNWVLIESK